jgi:tripartite-type tricarboxylate transporter receptor subunit TctC
LLLGSPTLAISPSLYRKLAYDPVRDLTPVAMAAEIPSMLTVHRNVPARSVKELVQLARAHPGKLAFGTGGAGTSNELGAHLFFEPLADLDRHKGASSDPGAVRRARGHGIATLVTVGPHIREGKLRGLALLGPERSPTLPNVPTSGQAGYPWLQMRSWYVVMAPAATPRSVIEKLNAAVTRIVRSADAKSRMASLGFEPMTGTPDEAARFIAVETDRWSKVTRSRRAGGIGMRISPELPSTAQPASRAEGWALFALGFRPFYLLAALWAALSLPLWIGQYFGLLPRLSYLSAIAWHAHEMVFGFAAAVLTGFLFTAVRNWTAEPTPTGAALAGLAAIWFAGRVLLISGPALPAALVDVAFLPLVAWSIWRPLRRARNRNQFFVVLLLVFAAANLAFHLGQAGIGSVAPGLAAEAALALLVVIVSIMSGRVIPAFTRNAIAHAAVRDIKGLDDAAVAVLAAALFAWIVALPTLLTIALCVAAVLTRPGYGSDPGRHARVQYSGYCICHTPGSPLACCYLRSHLAASSVRRPVHCTRSASVRSAE